MPAAQLVDVTKHFGPIRALSGVTLDIYPGEIHAVLGENGAGKTTLMNVLAGLVQPDGGTVKIEGTDVQFRSRRDSIQAGIGFVQQSLALVEELTLLENYMLGRSGGQSLKPRMAREELMAAAGRLGVALQPDTRVADLSIGERQLGEVAVNLAYGADILILDEPTSAAGVQGFDVMAPIVRQLCDEGAAVVYITHKLQEVRALAHRATVMRAGVVVSSYKPVDVSDKQLVLDMVGDQPRPASRTASATGETVVEFRHVSTAGHSRHGADLHGASGQLSQGEIVGVAAVAGSGEGDLAAVLAGMLQPTSGSITHKVTRIGVIPEDRAGAAIAPTMTVIDNTIVHHHRELASGGFIRWDGVRKFVRRLLRDYDVRAPGLGSPLTTLSGGNQQKLVIGRELRFDPELLIAHNPSSGLDVAASEDVKRHLVDAAAAGAGVLVISPDLDELFSICDRLWVLYEGRLVCDRPLNEVSVEEAANLMVGGAR